MTFTTNKIFIKNQIFTKNTSCKNSAFSEFYFLNYFSKINDTLRVPELLKFDNTKNQIHLKYIHGIPLITFIRHLQNKNFKHKNTDKIVNMLLLQSIKYVAYFHNITKKLHNSNDFYIENYNYKENLFSALQVLDKFSKLNLSDYNVQNCITSIFSNLESSCNVLYRDAGLYNILICIPENFSVEKWINDIFSNNDFENLKFKIVSQLYNLDFAESYKLICAEDDYSFIIESSVSQKFRIQLLEMINPLLRYDVYLFAAIFRNLRIAARHLIYLFENQDIYYTRYSNYGSLVEESPVYYLHSAYNRTKELSLLCPDFNNLLDYIFLLIESLTDKIEKELMIIINKNINSNG